MDTNCKIIEDLLPLYADEVCSKESAALIEEHLSHCEKCRQTLYYLQTDAPETSEAKTPLSSDSDKILKSVSKTLSKRAVYSAAGILSILLYWLLYTWMERLANIGDYRYMNSRFYEIFPVGTLIFPLLTLLWLGLHIRRMIKNKSWKNGLLLLATLVFLSLGQFSHLHQQSNLISVTGIATVKEKLSADCIVICCGDREVTLSASPSIVNLLQTNGTEYCFLYNTYKDNRTEGTLCNVITNSNGL